jgi:hypothetical protein
MSARPLFVVAGLGNGSGEHFSRYNRCIYRITLIDLLQAREAHLRTYHVLPPALLSNLSLKPRQTSRLFAKSGYNVALISRDSDNLHKFAAELKTAETDVSARMRSPIRILPSAWLIISSLYAGSGVPNNRL